MMSKAIRSGCVALMMVTFAGLHVRAQTRRQSTMTNPQGMLALHEQSYGHSVTWVELADGKVLLYGGGEFRVSGDAGVTWSEPFRGKDDQGKPVTAEALVRLSGKSIGMVSSQRPAGKPYSPELIFRRSDDEGKTWSPHVAINPPGSPAFMLQDVLLRTHSGRIILPVYLMIGQGGDFAWHLEGQPFVGGFVNGNFVSVDAHFYDPHFGASYVFFSDDDGKTWQRNRDGELFILLKNSDLIESTFEPSVTEISPGKLLMIMRTRVGRYFQAWSQDNGETWTRPQPTQLAGTQAPVQIRTIKETGHLLCVFTQQSSDEVRRGYMRTRLSSAISKNGGRLWEHFQNVESLHEETHVAPGPIEVVRPQEAYYMTGGGATQADPRYIAPLPVGYGRWSYPSVLLVRDRVLISHTYSWVDETGKENARNGSRLKVLPLTWFYGGRAPYDNDMVKRLSQPPRP